MPPVLDYSAAAPRRTIMARAAWLAGLLCGPVSFAVVGWRVSQTHNLDMLTLSIMGAIQSISFVFCCIVWFGSKKSTRDANLGLFGIRASLTWTSLMILLGFCIVHDLSYD